MDKKASTGKGTCMNSADFYYLDKDRVRLYCIKHLPDDFANTKRQCSFYNGDRMCFYESEQERVAQRVENILDNLG